MAPALARTDDFEQRAPQDVLTLRERMKAIVGRLEKEAEDRVNKRSLVEKRWIEDLTQYHGKYDDKILKELMDGRKSTLFINATLPKTNACEARLFDMLFPTDDRNWGIEPTPVPELMIEAEQASSEAARLKQEAAASKDPQAIAMAQQAEARAAEVQAPLEEARRRARAMQEEIDDHLRECRYAAQAREVIRDACKIGTGIMKGPVIGGRSRRAWTRDPETGAYVLAHVTDPRPKFWRVDPWSFFPDMDATSMEDCESVFERHLMNAKQLRKLAREPGFDPDAIRRLLRDEPRCSTPTYISELRAITGAYHDTSTDRYHVWEYHGPLSGEEMQALAMATGRADMLDDLGEEMDDPLQEIQVVIWFCQGEILKFGIHPLDSNENIYSVFCLEKDSASIFGFGIPYLMRHSQKALSSAWRIMLDNAGLSSGPQIVIDPEVVEPQNGEWTLEPRKIWLRKTTATPGAQPFQTFNIESHQVELANIIELARRNIDEETSIPIIAQGEQGSHVTQTAHGMSILINSVNVVFRRIVRNWDDDMTTPNIRRMYDFLMQFSPKDHIKGDYEVDARGSSVLLVREMQSASLMAFLLQFSGHPILGRFLKQDGLPGLRRLVQTMMIPADELVKSDDDIAEDEAAAAEQPPEPNPEMEALAVKMNIAQIEAQSRERAELIKRDTAMIQLAARGNMDLEKLRLMLADKDADRQSRERQFAAEAALTQRLGPTGGGHF